MGTVKMEMPKYKCNKEVHALQIKEINDFEGGEESPGGKMIKPVDRRYAPIYVDGDYMAKHKPQVGGYYVVYKDGYASFSPAKAFVEGYELI